MEVAFGAQVPEGHDVEKPRFNAPEHVLGDNPRPEVVIATSGGDIRVELFADESPVTVNSFLFLAGQGFYNGTVVHRVVPGFVVQMGDPTGTGSGGPGYRFDDELGAARTMGYARGTVAMANAGPNTNGSQFFICLADVSLPPAYAVFGRVAEGMEVVDAIAALPRRGETPVQTVFMESVTTL